MAKETVRAMFLAAADELGADDDEDWLRQGSDLGKWALQSASAHRIRAMIELARSEPGVPVTPAELDADPWVLNCLNGVLDLRTGELLPHDPDLLLTKLAPVQYDQEARLQLWDDFLEGAIPDEATRQYVQKLAGYSLAGVASEDF